MREHDAAFLEASIKRYYFGNPKAVPVPERTGEREFGYQRFNHGMVRHLPIKNEKELRLMLVQNSPSDVYCSNSYYSFPDLPMNEKDWKGADLIFDIDAKDLGLECRPDHTVSVCGGCGRASGDPARCPGCGSSRLEKKSLPCKKCTGASKSEVTRLNGILTGDLGVPGDCIRVYFSGNEGFHVHAPDPAFHRTGSRERKELVDYVMFKGAVPEPFGMNRNKPNQSVFPAPGDAGWRGRFSKHVRSSKGVRELFAGGYQRFREELERASGAIGTRIDPNVTADVHRIFRMPGSINGKSGLAKVECGDLGRFDPYREAAVLGDGPADVTADCPIRLELGGKKFGPYRSERVTVPTYAAAYMVCKGLATAAPP